MSGIRYQGNLPDDWKDMPEVGRCECGHEEEDHELGTDELTQEANSCVAKGCGCREFVEVGNE